MSSAIRLVNHKAYIPNTDYLFVALNCYINNPIIHIHGNKIPKAETYSLGEKQGPDKEVNVKPKTIRDFLK